MRTHEERQFRIPIDELRAVLKKQHGVDLAGVEPYIDRESVVFSVQQISNDLIEPEIPPSSLSDKPDLPPIRSRRRQRRRRRNRIKTRGWKVVGRFTNSHGLVAKVYEPFVSALKGTNGSRMEQRAVVREIMEKNGNAPTPESVDYYLENTLDYLNRHTEEGEGSR